MEAGDGSMGIDFEGVDTKIIINHQIEYTIADGRKVKILFISDNHKTEISQALEAENIYPIDQQRGGWQAILDNFKKQVESKL